MNDCKGKYYPKTPLKLDNRTWPEKSVKTAPIWCSVDLRDGNQALSEPMNLEEKVDFFKMLTSIGFKEIEIGFPSASETEFETTRKLIDDNLIPDDVYIQVLVQAREHLINKTFEAIKGAKNVILHLYSGISVNQRDIVFNKSVDEIIEMAVDGARLIKKLGDEYEKNNNMNIRYEYSPEGFTNSEPETAVAICQAVMDVFEEKGKKVILNLPSSVESTPSNVYADMIEYFCNNIKGRNKAIISIHPHNDRGTAVAATELGLLAGAERVEGTIFGNGERTGNVDIITLALNMYTQGIDPGLELSDINRIRKTYELTTRMQVPVRQPYSGDLVFTAFSGSHQDAISKGKAYMKKTNSKAWRVPYLPIDPSDIGREYEPIIRINSQSGKGGSAFIMSDIFGYNLPKDMRPEFGNIIQKYCEKRGTELSPRDVFAAFKSEYLDVTGPYVLTDHKLTESSADKENRIVTFSGKLSYNGKDTKLIKGVGNGPIDAFFNALSHVGITGYHFVDYSEHAVSLGSDAQAVSYIHLTDKNGKNIFGVGLSHNINYASIKGVLCAINRSVKKESEGEN